MVVSFDRVAEVYDKTREFPTFIIENVTKALIEEMQDYKLILDVGVGTARLSKPLQDNGYSVVGLDISSKMMKRAMEKGMQNLLKGTVSNLPFQDKSFDVTMSVALLHLIREWKTTLREISRVTRNLLVSVLRRGRSPAHEEYRGLLVKHRWISPRLGTAESELEKLVKPARSIYVGSYEASTEQSLASLEQRAYSHQWDIPEETHRRIIQQLKQQSFPRAYAVKVHISLWEIESIQDFLQSSEH